MFLTSALSEMLYTKNLFLGPPHDLQVQEVRKDSLVLLWKAPVYQGRDPVNGYYIDIKEAEADFEMWRGVNEKATNKTFMKVCIHVEVKGQWRWLVKGCDIGIPLRKKYSLETF